MEVDWEKVKAARVGVVRADDALAEAQIVKNNAVARLVEASTAARKADASLKKALWPVDE